MLLIASGRYRFRPRLWATLAAAAGIALTLALGNWQLNRAHYKEDLQNRQTELSRQPSVRIGTHEIRPNELLLRKVEVAGEYDPARTVYLDNRIHDHQPGFHVITPLRIAGSNKYVLINRGWIAVGRERTKVPDVKTPVGMQTVSGIAVAPSERFIELSSQVAEGQIRQNLVLERYRQATGLDVQPILIRQTDTVDDGLIRDWPPVDLGRNTHLAYAVQWFAMSIAILIYYLVTHVHRRKTS